MKAKITSFYCPEIEDLYNFIPNDPECFSFLLELMVGANDYSEGSDLLNIQICTPKWFLTILKKEDILLGRHFLIVMEYNFDRIYRKITTLIESCEGNNWSEVTAKLCRIGHWEFEDYQSNE